MASVGKKTLWSAQATSGTTTGSVQSLDGRTDNFVAYVNPSALGAGTTATVKIQHSPDAVKWFDLVSFTVAAATAAIKDQSEFVVANSNVLPNIRPTVSFSGGTTTGTFTLELYFDPVK